MQVNIKLLGCCLVFLTLLSCADNDADIQDKTRNREATQSAIKDEKPSTTTTIDTDADLQGKAKLSVPIFQNELANKLVGRLHAIQIAKAANGSTPDLQKQEEVVMQELPVFVFIEIFVKCILKIAVQSLENFYIFEME